jgi:hypothetical protein
MNIAIQASEVRKANEKFYGSLQCTDKQSRLAAADQVVKSLNAYVNAVHQFPEELTDLEEDQRQRGLI